MKGQAMIMLALIIAAFLITLGIANIKVNIINAPQADVWFDDNFFLRQGITYNISLDGDVTQVIIPIILDTETLITADKMLSDCADYRITNSAQAALTFNIENGTCNTNDTVVWVLADLSDGNNTLFHYYNNLSAVNTTSTNTTFDQTVITYQMDQDPDPENYASTRYDLTDFSHTQSNVEGAHGDGHSYEGASDFSELANLDDAIPTKTGDTFTVYTWVNFGGTRDSDGFEKLIASHDIFRLQARDISGFKLECEISNSTGFQFNVNTSTNVSDIVDTWHFFGCGVNTTDMFIFEGSDRDNTKLQTIQFNGSFIGGEPSFTIKLGTDASNPGLTNNLIGFLDSMFIYNTSKSIDYMEAVAFGRIFEGTERNFTEVIG